MLARPIARTECVERPRNQHAPEADDGDDAPTTTRRSVIGLRRCAAAGAIASGALTLPEPPLALLVLEHRSIEIVP